MAALWPARGTRGDRQVVRLSFCACWSPFSSCLRRLVLAWLLHQLTARVGVASFRHSRVAIGPCDTPVRSTWVPPPIQWRRAMTRIPSGESTARRRCARKFDRARGLTSCGLRCARARCLLGAPRLLARRLSPLRHAHLAPRASGLPRRLAVRLVQPAARADSADTGPTRRGGSNEPAPGGQATQVGCAGAGGRARETSDPQPSARGRSESPAVGRLAQWQPVPAGERDREQFYDRCELELFFQQHRDCARTCAGRERDIGLQSIVVVGSRPRPSDRL